MTRKHLLCVGTLAAACALALAGPIKEDSLIIFGEIQKLKAERKAVDNELTLLKNQIEALQLAIKNYEYVKMKNTEWLKEKKTP